MHEKKLSSKGPPPTEPTPTTTSDPEEAGDYETRCPACEGQLRAFLEGLVCTHCRVLVLDWRVPQGSN
jgi:hypothetical protein